MAPLIGYSALRGRRAEAKCDERAGVLPVLVAGYFQLRKVDGLGVASLADMPLWQGVFAPFLIITWWIGFMAVRMRLTLELYAMVLADALENGEARTPGAA